MTRSRVEPVTEADILFELLLKFGLDLTVPIEQKKIAGKTVHSIGAGTLLVCLATQITAAEVEPLALGIVDVWLDTGFEGGRHARRVGKIARLEEDLFTPEARRGSLSPPRAKEGKRREHQEG